MGDEYMWAGVGPDAQIHNDRDLFEASEDGDIEPGTVGVSMADGSDGVMLYGDRERLIDWAENLAQRLRAGEGASGYGEERMFLFTGADHELRDADGDIVTAGGLYVGHELRGNSGEGNEADGWPELTGDTWMVTEPGKPGEIADGVAGFVVTARKVLD